MTTEATWVAIGFVGQGLFFMRFLVQWIASEKSKKSVLPDMFWYFSIAGGSVLLMYSIYRLDPVFMAGQGLGLVIYARNIHFVRKAKQERQNVSRETKEEQSESKRGESE